MPKGSTVPNQKSPKPTPITVSKGLGPSQKGKPAKTPNAGKGKTAPKLT